MEIGGGGRVEAGRSTELVSLSDDEGNRDKEWSKSVEEDDGVTNEQRSKLYVSLRYLNAGCTSVDPLGSYCDLEMLGGVVPEDESLFIAALVASSQIEFLRFRVRVTPRHLALILSHMNFHRYSSLSLERSG